jgi:hypothetical protein
MHHTLKALPSRKTSRRTMAVVLARWILTPLSFLFLYTLVQSQTQCKAFQAKYSGQVNDTHFTNVPYNDHC